MPQNQGSKGEKKSLPGPGDDSKGDADDSPPRETTLLDTSTKSLPDADGCRSVSDRSSSPLDVTSSHGDVLADERENAKLVAREGSLGECFIESAFIIILGECMDMCHFS